MTREELIDNMVSCYDNGDAMLEYVEEYYSQRTCENCHSCLQYFNGNNIEPQCNKLLMEVELTFSCNKWESRDER